MQKFPIAAAACAALCLVLAGCSGRTPEERLEKTAQMLRDRDTLGAMLEAREMIKKFPDHPRTVEAHYLLAQVYVADRRPDEAVAEMEIVLDAVPQTTEFGRNTLRDYLTLLQQMRRFDDAMKAVDKFQKKYASDEGTSLSLTVARATLLTAAKETTRAREILTGLRTATTTTAERNLYRDLLVQTYLADQNVTAALTMYEHEFGTEKNEASKRELALRISMFDARMGRYEEARKWAETATGLFDQAMKEELDTNKRTELALQLAMFYSDLGNLAGAKTVLRALYDARVNLDVMPALVRTYVNVLLRQDKVDDAVKFMREVAVRIPESKLDVEAARLETLKSQNQVSRIARVDTSTMTLRFAKDPVIVPKNLPAPADTTTTPTADVAGKLAAAAAVAKAEKATTDAK